MEKYKMTNDESIPGVYSRGLQKDLEFRLSRAISRPLANVVVVFQRSFVLVAIVVILAFSLFLRLARVNYGLPYPIQWDEPRIMNAALEIMQSGNLQPTTFSYGSFPIYLATTVSSVAFIADSENGTVSSLDEFAYYFPKLESEHEKGGDNGTVSFLVGDAKAYQWNRIVLVMVGVLTVALVFVVAKSLGFTLGALIGAALLGAATQHIFSTSTISVDGMAAFLTTLAVYVSLRLIGSTNPTKWFTALGVIVGLAAATKITAGVIVVLLPVSFFVCPGSARRISDVARGLAASVLTFVVAEPYSILSLPYFLAGMGREAFHYHNEPDPQIGALTFGDQGRAVLATLDSNFGVVALALAVVGLTYLAIRNPRAAALLILFPLIYLPFMMHQVLYFPRNVLIIMPSIAILAAVGTEKVVHTAVEAIPSDRLGLVWRDRTRRRNYLSCILFGVLFIGAVLPHFVDQWGLSMEIRSEVETREQAISWLRSHVSPGTRVAVSAQIPFYLPNLSKAGYVTVPVNPIADPCWYVGTQFDYFVSNQDGPPFSQQDLVEEIPGELLSPSGVDHPIYDPRVAIYRNSLGADASGQVSGASRRCP